MKVKKFRAPDRAAALKQIRDELGPQAVIVHEQRVRPPFFGLFGKPQVEMLAALEDDQIDGEPAGSDGKQKGVEANISAAARQLAADVASAPPLPLANSKLPSGLSHEGASKLAAILETFPRSGQPVPPAMAASLADLVQRAMAGQDLDAASPAPAPTQAPTQPPSPPARTLTPPTNGRLSRHTARADGSESAQLDAVQGSLAELQRAVERLTQQSQDAQLPREAPALRAVYQHLILQELDPGLALDITGTISDELAGEVLVSQQHVLDRVVELLVDRLQSAALHLRPASQKGETGLPTVVVLVGPTGVGKTTTLAKLASYLAFTEEKRVTLITTDTFRIAAAAQLGTYADILELPFEVVYRPEDLSPAIHKHRAADLILVDTPGCGQQDQVQIGELSAFVNASLDAVPQATVLLTVAAPTKLRDLLHIQQGFGRMPIHGLILTKLDETETYGPIVSFAARSKKPVYYLTTGQKVPSDIEEASDERIARLVVSGLSHGQTPNGVEQPVRTREAEITPAQEADLDREGVGA